MRKSKSVLIVEDEAALAHAMNVKLTASGHKTTVAENGQIALDLLAKHHYDVVLLDLMMPIKNGFQVLEGLRGHEHAPTVYVLSNLAQPDDRKKALDLGATKFLVKSDTSLASILEHVEAA